MSMVKRRVVVWPGKTGSVRNSLLKTRPAILRSSSAGAEVAATPSTVAPTPLVVLV